MTGLSDAQARHVRTTFVHLDSLLESVEAALRPASPFSRVRQDVDATDARLLESYAAAARSRMLAALDRLGVARPEPVVAAHWSIETALQFADIALSELDAGGLRAYGAVDDEAAAEVTALAADLRELLRRAIEVVRADAAGELAGRLAAVEGVVGDVLRAVDRTIRERGLAEVRPLLAAAAARAADDAVSIGMFGRVSAGKSSLINALAGTDALPVGATPATAVPLRVRRGPAGATVAFEGGERRRTGLDQISEFATEDRNPGNRLGVRAVEVFVPTVPEGLEFLDTPGVGSLGASGPAQAFAWLPRCDLGIVLIAAGTAVARDDLALVSALRHAGVASRILMSKSDLLDDAERERARDYVARELRAAAPEGGPSVLSVSTLPARRAELDAMRRDVLEPLAADHHRAARRAMASRLRALLAACAAAQGSRAGGSQDRRLALARARLDAMGAIREAAEHLRGLADTALGVAADAVVAAWRAGEDARGATRYVLLEAAGRQLAAVRESVESARAAPASTGGAAPTRVPPLFDPPLLDQLPDLAPPRRLPGPLWRRRAAHRLAPLRQPLDEAFTRYATRMQAWGVGLLEELTVASWEVEQDATAPRDPELEELGRTVNAWERDA